MLAYLCHPFYLLLASSPSVTISNEGEIEGEKASIRQPKVILKMLAYG
jgi:hypothetical protein